MLHHVWQTCKLLVMEYTISHKKIHKKKISLPLFTSGKIVQKWFCSKGNQLKISTIQSRSESNTQSNSRYEYDIQSNW